MKTEYFLPLFLTFVDILCSIPYFIQHNYMRGMYWVFAAGITFCATFSK
jgi:hypothetical protein